MAIPVKMPQKGLSEESCIITKWSKKKGDPVKAGDVLFTIETGKSTFDVEADADGILLDVFFDEGDEVPVSLFVCAVGNPGESADEFNPNKKDAVNKEILQEDAGTVKNSSTENAGISKAASQAVLPQNSEDNLKISPRAKNLAAKSGVDYRYASPTGPNGRIIEKDIFTLMENGPILTTSAREEYLKQGKHTPVAGTGLGGRITTSDLHVKSLWKLSILR
jgi:pyruvate dehydrogenase E2 component (dihydrolipoamide acetyltransferase)